MRRHWPEQAQHQAMRSQAGHPAPWVRCPKPKLPCLSRSHHWLQLRGKQGLAAGAPETAAAAAEVAIAAAAAAAAAAVSPQGAMPPTQRWHCQLASARPPLHLHPAAPPLQRAWCLTLPAAALHQQLTLVLACLPLCWHLAGLLSQQPPLSPPPLLPASAAPGGCAACRRGLRRCPASAWRRLERPRPDRCRRCCWHRALLPSWTAAQGSCQCTR